MREARKLARLLEAATRDRDPGRFFRDFESAVSSHQISWRDYRVRDLFESFVKDGAEIVRSWKPNSGGYDGYNTVLLEETGAVSTAAFRAITGNLIYNHVLDVWNLPEFIGDRLVTTIPSTLMQEEIPGVGGLGDVAEVIPELGEFPMAGLNEELVRLPKTKKTGFMIALSKEIVFFDRLGVVIQRAEDIARFLRLNKEKRILDVVTGIVNNYIRNDQAYDTYQDAGGPWVNLKTSNGLIDWTSVEAAEMLFANMTDPNTGELISTTPTQVLVPKELEYTARRIWNATQAWQNTGLAGAPDTAAFARQTNSPNPVTQMDIVTSPHVKARTSSSSTWFMGDFQRAFVYVENQPVTIEPSPLGDESFRRDIVAAWKGSERGAAGTREPRHATKCTA